MCVSVCVRDRQTDKQTDRQTDRPCQYCTHVIVRVYAVGEGGGGGGGGGRDRCIPALPAYLPAVFNAIITGAARSKDVGAEPTPQPFIPTYFAASDKNKVRRRKKEDD